MPIFGVQYLKEIFANCTILCTRSAFEILWQTADRNPPIRVQRNWPIPVD